jgi:hypothetical protein
MADFYQVTLPDKISKSDPEYLRWEKLNFILRQLWDLVGNIDGRQGTMTFKNSLSMTSHQITNGPNQTNLQDTDYVTKSYFRSSEFGQLAASLLVSGGKTPITIQGSTGTPSSGGGGGGGAVNTTAPLAGGGTPPITISIAQATGSVNGYLSATDWTTFNNKQSALTIGNLTEATSSVLTITGGTGAIIGSGTTIQVKVAGAGQDGYLSAANWTTFNAKVGGSGTTGKIPKFTAASTIGDSIIKEASSKIGIGTSGAPAYTLEVAGQVKATDGSILPTVKSLSISAGAIATDCSLGNMFRVTMDASATLSNPTSMVDGQVVRWEFVQDATGGRILTLGTDFLKPTNIPSIVLTTTPNATDMLGTVYNSSLGKFIITGLLTDY